MEILFLGTGTSQGVPPIIGCIPNEFGIDVAARLDLNNPKNWRGRSCVHLVIDGQHVQIDAGPEFRLACIKYKVPAVDYFFLTHEHSDHILGMEDLRSYCNLRHGNAIPIYTTPSAKKRVECLYDYGIRDFADDGYLAFKPIVAEKRFCLPNGTLVETTILPHGKTISTLGIVFTEKATGKRVAYYTDCSRLTEEAKELARNVDVLIIDGLRPEPHPTHLSVSQACELGNEMGAKQIYLIHMTWHIDHEEWSKKLPPNVALSYDGMTLSLD